MNRNCIYVFMCSPHVSVMWYVHFLRASFGLEYRLCRAFSSQWLISLMSYTAWLFSTMSITDVHSQSQTIKGQGHSLMYWWRILVNVSRQQFIKANWQLIVGDPIMIKQLRRFCQNIMSWKYILSSPGTRLMYKKIIFHVRNWPLLLDSALGVRYGVTFSSEHV